MGRYWNHVVGYHKGEKIVRTRRTRITEWREKDERGGGGIMENEKNRVAGGKGIEQQAASLLRIESSSLESSETALTQSFHKSYLHVSTMLETTQI